MELLSYTSGDGDPISISRDFTRVKPLTSLYVQIVLVFYCSL